MAATKAEFLELVGLESLVDLDRLRDMAFYGIPPSIRGEIWMILIPALVVSTEDERIALPTLSTEDFEDSTATDEFFSDSDVLRVLKTELSKYGRRNLFKSLKQQERMRLLLIAYLKRYPSMWHVHHAALIHILGPLVLVMKRESDVLASLTLLMCAIDSTFSPFKGRQVLGRFLMLFRSRLPVLFTHFEEEDLEASRWAAPWLQWLLCRELPMDCCLRLWDSYLAAPDGHGFSLHSFVCLAILENCQADLIELENQELMAFLQHLPSFDMERIILQAQYLAHDFRNT